MYRAVRYYCPNQITLMPRNPQEWLEKNHFAYFIEEFLRQMDLNIFLEKLDPHQSCAGAPTYNPRMILGILLYSYSQGVFSARKIAKNITESIPLTYLAGEQRPSHSTLSRFRTQHSDAFKELLAMMIHFAVKNGYIDFNELGVDGTKIAASASMGKNVEVEVARDLQTVAKDIVDNSEQIDQSEEKEQQLAKRSAKKRKKKDPPEKKRSQEEMLEEIKQSHKEAAQEPPPPAQSKQEEKHEDKSSAKKELTKENLTDSDSRIMKNSKGYLQGYNAQLAVEGKNQLIVGARVISQQNDQNQLLPMVDDIKENYGREPDTVLADAGYCNEETLKTLNEEYECEGVIATGRSGGSKRKINEEKLPYTKKMSDKLNTPRGKEIYRKRQWICEAPIGWLKNNTGFDKFHLRGLVKVNGELNLVVNAINLLRIHRISTSRI